MSPGSAWNLLKEAARNWSEDKVPRLSAALAYYTILSSAPLVVITLAVAGLVLGREAVQGQVVEQVGGMIGKEGGEAVQAMIANAGSPGSGVLGVVVGTVLLLVGASGVFVELQDSLNTIWGVAPKPGRGWWTAVRERFLSFAMVLGTGFVLLVTLVISAALSALTRAFGLSGEAVVGQVLNSVVTLLVVTLLFALIYKVLPDVKLAWRDVWVGAFLTSALFTAGKFLIGLYLGHAGIGSAYGAAGSLVVFVVWVYYSAQILFFGAETTKVFANNYGQRIRPAANAEFLTEQARAEQGLDRRKATGAIRG